MEKFTFLVTGGGGFIGSNITEQVLKLGHTVKVFDNFMTGNKKNLSFVDALDNKDKKRFSLIEEDIRNLKAVNDAVRGVDYILHQAAIPSVTRSIADPITTNEVNINGALNILEAARKACNVKKIVYAASSSVYGDTPTLPKVETMPSNPLSPYALQKFAGEEYMRIFNAIYGVKTVSLRYFNVFGPKQDPNSPYAAVIPKFITSLSTGMPLVVHGDGEQTRDFTYIENVVQANIKAAFSSDETNGKAFNIACGKQVSLNELILILEKIIGKKAKVEHTNARSGDVKRSLADISLAKRLLGYNPSIQLEEGLKKTVECF